MNKRRLRRWLERLETIAEHLDQAQEYKDARTLRALLKVLEQMAAAKPK